MVSGERLSQPMKGNLLDSAGATSLLSWNTTLDMALAMLGAFRIRLGKSADPRNLEDALLARAAPNVVGVRVH